MTGNRQQKKNDPKFRLFGIFFLLVCTSTVVAEPVKSKYPPKPLEFGVFPHLSVSHLEENFGEIADRVARSLDRRVNFNAKLSFDFFKTDLESGIYDIAFLQPFDYVRANSAHGYKVIAAQDMPLKGILAVRPSSNIKDPSDLKGKTVTLPPKDTAVSYLVRDWLLANGYRPGKEVLIKYETSHISCLQKSLFGFAEVCGTAEPPLNFVRDKLGFEFEIIAETNTIPHTLFAVHPRVPEEDRKKIVQVLLTLHKDKQLAENTRLKPFRIAKDSEYDVVREISRRAASN